MVAGSNPLPATIYQPQLAKLWFFVNRS